MDPDVRTWRELGLSAEDEQKAKEQFRQRLLKKTEGWADQQFVQFLNMEKPDLLRLRKGYLAWFSLSQLIDYLLRLGINVNLYIPSDGLPANRGKLRIIIGLDEISSPVPAAPHSEADVQS